MGELEQAQLYKPKLSGHTTILTQDLLPWGDLSKYNKVCTCIYLIVCVAPLGAGILQVCQSDSQYVEKEHIIQGLSGEGTLNYMYV